MQTPDNSTLQSTTNALYNASNALAAALEALMPTQQELADKLGETLSYQHELIEVSDDSYREVKTDSAVAITTRLNALINANLGIIAEGEAQIQKTLIINALTKGNQAFSNAQQAYNDGSDYLDIAMAAFGVNHAVLIDKNSDANLKFIEAQVKKATADLEYVILDDAIAAALEILNANGF